ncbi:MAG: alpha/beta fold hydrolase [Pyrobaculum sp.]
MPKAVAFHGYRSSPSNIQWLTQPLWEAGFGVAAPVIRDVEDGYEAGLRELPVEVAAGHSMGGTVALLLAARNPGSVKCVVAVAAPVDRRLQLQYLLQSEDPISGSWRTTWPLSAASWSSRRRPATLVATCLLCYT